MPTFKHTEIELGRTLGSGGFGIVNEVTAFDLEHEPEITKEAEVAEESKSGKEDNNDKEKGEDNNESDDKDGNSATKKQVGVAVRTDLYEDDSHYDIEEAREVMNKRCLRRGVTRFALKRLHDDLSEVEKARAMIDLAVEAKYLSVVWHPNIGTLTGTICRGDFCTERFI